jgi:hypothetical protein
VDCNTVTRKGFPCVTVLQSTEFLVNDRPPASMFAKSGLVSCHVRHQVIVHTLPFECIGQCLVLPGLS